MRLKGGGNIGVILALAFAGTIQTLQPFHMVFGFGNKVWEYFGKNLKMQVYAFRKLMIFSNLSLKFGKGCV